MTPHAPIGAGPDAGSWNGTGRRRGGSHAVTALAATLGVHLSALLVVQVLELTPFGIGERVLASAAMASADDDATLAVATPPLAPSCDADAILRAAAGAALCATPFTDDVDACLALVDARLQTDFIHCHIDQLDLPEVAMIDLPPAAEKIPEIEAEPLLEPLTPEEVIKFEEARREVAQQPPPPPPPPPQAPQPPAQRAQVIETVKPAEEVAPDQAAFLAEHDSRADQQTVARGSKFEEIAAAPKPEELAAKDKPKDATAEPPPEEIDQIGPEKEAPPVPGALSMRDPGAIDPGETAQDKKVAGELAGKNGPEGDGAPRRGDGAIDERERTARETEPGQGGAGGGAPRAPNLRANDEVLERVVGGGSVDHVEVDDGDENAFNTKRWVYASFFNRLKRHVAQNWEPVPVWRREDPDGKQYGHKSRLTVLRVSIDAKGHVKKLDVLGPSGVPALDEEAMRAFRAAQPFPNPPDALVDASGLITFEFSFNLTLKSQKTSWKIQRSM